METARSPRLAPTLLVVGAALLWSTGGVGVKLILLPAMSLAGYRSLFAAIMMTLVLGALALAQDVSLVPLFRRPLVYASALAYAVMVIAFVVAAKLTTAANAVLYSFAVRHLRALESSLVAMLEPILSPLWAFLGAAEVPSSRAFVGGAIILLSVGAQVTTRAHLRDPAPSGTP